MKGLSRSALVSYLMALVASIPLQIGMLQSMMMSSYMGKVDSSRDQTYSMASFPFEQVSHSILNCRNRLSIALMLNTLSSTTSNLFQPIFLKPILSCLSTQKEKSSMLSVFVSNCGIRSRLSSLMNYLMLFTQSASSSSSSSLLSMLLKFIFL